MHKLRPLRLASFPSRGCCCWRKGGNQGIGLFCPVMQTALGPSFSGLWWFPTSQGGAFFLTQESAGLLSLSWAVLGLQPAPGSLLGVTASFLVLW